MMGLVLYPYVYLMYVQRLGRHLAFLRWVCCQAVQCSEQSHCRLSASHCGRARSCADGGDFRFRNCGLFRCRDPYIRHFQCLDRDGQYRATSQLALFAFLLMVLISVEMFARRRGGVSNASSGQLGVPRIAPSALSGVCVLICALPIGLLYRACACVGQPYIRQRD